MDLNGNLFDRKIQLAQESIEFLRERIDGLSAGAKEMYLRERQNDLKLLQGNKKFFAKELENFNFNALIDEMIEDVEKFKE